jgi:hypothetical protein
MVSHQVQQQQTLVVLVVAVAEMTTKPNQVVLGQPIKVLLVETIKQVRHTLVVVVVVQDKLEQTVLEARAEKVVMVLLRQSRVLL